MDNFDTIVEEGPEKRKYKKCRRRGKRYSSDFKLKAVKLFLEESVPQSVIMKECNIGGSTMFRWVNLYRQYGEAGLISRHRGSNRCLASPVKRKIIEIKRAHPLFGIKRISQLLKRAFFLSASTETVRKTLHQSSLMAPPHRKKPQHNIVRPRFFERSTPNQLWQTDIFTFRLGGRYAYLIGYIDDYSRFITGLDLFSSQTGQNVIEVYRRAASEYSPPKEMLTDNGRQYTSWRGNSRFEAELKKDHIHHIKSRPHHPMTLGKIERFWKTIFQEFLSRAQFSSFEDAQQRIRQWVKYYNHKRPHQGIGGLCPADRYFEIQGEVRKTIEQGIQDNLLEMALRGKPRLPFYMVGRMDGQSVVLRAEKGKLRLSVADEEQNSMQEVIYTLNKEGHTDGDVAAEGEKGEETTGNGIRSDGEMPGSAGSMDGTPQARGGLQGVIDQVADTESMAETCDGGDAAGSGAACAGEQGNGFESAPAGNAGEEPSGTCLAGEAGTTSFESSGMRESGDIPDKRREENQIELETMHEPYTGQGSCTAAGHGDAVGAWRPDNS